MPVVPTTSLTSDLNSRGPDLFTSQSTDSHWLANVELTCFELFSPDLGASLLSYLAFTHFVHTGQCVMAFARYQYPSL